jgi:hypothetical protein
MFAAVGAAPRAGAAIYLKYGPEVAYLQNQVVGIGPGTSLADKLGEVQGDLANNDTADACGTLGAFINEVTAQGLAASLVTQAQAIQTGLGC